jgi:hypothetical protein
LSADDSSEAVGGRKLHRHGDERKSRHVEARGRPAAGRRRDTAFPRQEKFADGATMVRSRHGLPRLVNTASPAGLVLPVAEYTHDLGKSVTGGFVYRGSQVPTLHGRYVYGDFISGRIWSLNAATPDDPDVREHLHTGLNIASFGLDTSGELLFCAFDGMIYRLVGAG